MRPGPAALAALAALLAAFAAAQEATQEAAPAPVLDLAPPPGATLAWEEAEPAGSHALAVGPWDGALPTTVAEGAVTHEVWQVAEPGTTLELLRPWRGQLEAQGFEVLLDCDTEACGGFDFRAAVEVVPPPAMFVDLADFRYLAARRGGEAVSLLASRSAGTGFVQVVRVRPEAPTPPPEASLDAAAAVAAGLGARLEAEGRAVLDGLRFASGSADLAEGGEASLAALAAWLAADGARRVAIVGHTDATGPLDANVALSRRRAEAVADRLAQAHGVARGRLEAEGMGWLAPVATNLTAEGREANRRVEAVALPP